MDRGHDADWEQRCVARAKRGDRQAFADLYRAFAPSVFRTVLMPRLGNRAVAEDALSETFRVVLERLDQYEDRGAGLWPWLARVAMNKAADAQRKQGRGQRSLQKFESLLAPLRVGPHRPDEALFADCSKKVLDEAIDQSLRALNPRYRRALELRFLEDLPRARCAELLEVKLGTFDVLLLRALRAFRKVWDAHLQQGGGRGGRRRPEERVS